MNTISNMKVEIPGTVVRFAVGLCLTAGASRASLFPAPQMICPSEKLVVDEDEYFAEYHGDPCNFEKDGDLERIVEFGPGITGRAVTNGHLCFTTGEKGNFFWRQERCASLVPCGRPLP